MKPHKKTLDIGFSEYEALQARHIHALENESMPDLAAMTKESDLAFIQLKQSLKDFIDNTDISDDNLPMPADYNTRFTSIIAMSKKISAIVDTHKHRLQTGLKKIQQGKTAMQAYKKTNMNY